MAYTGRKNPAVMDLGYHLNDREAQDAAARAGIPYILDTPQEFVVGTACAALDVARCEVQAAKWAVEKWRRELATSRQRSKFLRSYHIGDYPHHASTRAILANTLRHQRGALAQASQRLAAAEIAYTAAAGVLTAALDAYAAARSVVA